MLRVQWALADRAPADQEPPAERVPADQEPPANWAPADQEPAMNITLEYIRDRLGVTSTISVSNDSKWKRPSWFQVILYDSSASFEEEFILFGLSDAFAEPIRRRALISIGEPSAKVLKNNDVLVIRDASDPDTIFRDIQKLVLNLNLWESALSRILQENSGNAQRAALDSLFTRAADLLQNSVFFHDENFYLLGNTESGGVLGLTRWEYDPVRGGYTLPLEILNEFKIDAEYQQTMHTHGPCMFSANMFGYRIMYQNIWDDDRYRGRICVNELNREFYESDYLLLDRLACMIHDSFQQREAGAYRQMLSMTNLIARIIDREPVQEAQVAEVLGQYGWRLDDGLFCACLLPEERDLSANTLQYYCTILTGRFPHSCAMLYESSIVIVVNCGRSGITPADFRSEISLILRDGLLKAGISNVVPGFGEVYFAYRQAVCAYETGASKHPDLWCFSFGDVCVDYLVAQMAHDLPARHLISPDLYALMAYDQTHTSELFKTFCTYLQNDRNLARTAELLEIHRSTLLFRMRKINELVKADYKNFDARFYLLLSMKLMEGHSS